MRYERRWLALGWTAVAVLAFAAVTRAFPPVVVIETAGVSYRHNLWTRRVVVLVEEMQDRQRAE